MNNIPSSPTNTDPDFDLVRLLDKAASEAAVTAAVQALAIGVIQGQGQLQPEIVAQLPQTPQTAGSKTISPGNRAAAANLMRSLKQALGCTEASEVQTRLNACNDDAKECARIVVGRVLSLNIRNFDGLCAGLKLTQDQEAPICIATPFGPRLFNNRQLNRLALNTVTRDSGILKTTSDDLPALKALYDEWSNPDAVDPILGMLP